MLWRSFTFGYISLYSYYCVFVCIFTSGSFPHVLPWYSFVLRWQIFHGFIRWVGCSQLDAGADSRARVLIPCALSQCFFLYRFRVFFTRCATVAYIYALSFHTVIKGVLVAI